MVREICMEGERVVLEALSWRCTRPRLDEERDNVSTPSEGVKEWCIRGQDKETGLCM